MIHLSEIIQSFSQLFFPHLCAGCGSDIVSERSVLCLTCLNDLPVTNFHLYEDNPVEKIYTGRVHLKAAASYCYFTKDSMIQSVLHQLKYKGNKEAGLFMGKLMAIALQESSRFKNIDALIPLPLFKSREKQRGYNQAAMICEGMGQLLQLPVFAHAVSRLRNTETQTHKTRIERWQNMEGRFMVTDPSGLAGMHLLLVDDVVTTGATLDACAQSLLEVPGTSVSIYTLAYTVK